MASWDVDRGGGLIERDDAARARRAIEIDREHRDRLTRGRHGRDLSLIVADLQLRGDGPIAAAVELIALSHRTGRFVRRRSDVWIVARRDHDVATVGDREDERAE